MARRVKQGPQNVDALIRQFELKLERLKVLYEQYFLGIQKREPRVAHHEVARLMRELDRIKIYNTRLRYRYRSMVQRFNTYRTYWNRTIRTINNGTYHRDLARMRRKWQREGINVDMPTTGRMQSVAEVEKLVVEAVKQKKELEKGGKPAVKPAVKKSAAEIRGRSGDQLRKDIEPDISPIQLPADEPPVKKSARPLVQKPAPGGVSLPDGFSDQQMQSIYRRYRKAKKIVGEDPNAVPYDSLASSLAGQVPKLREMNKGQAVDFDVVIRKGKVVLKAKSK